MKISRHNVSVSKIDIEDELIKISDRLPKLISKLKNNPLSINLAVATNLQLMAAFDSIVLSLSKNEIYQHLFYTLQFGINYMKLATHADEQVQLKIGDSIATTVGFKTRDYIGYGNWELLFYLATVLRDEQSIFFINTIPNSFMERSNVSFDELDFAAADILKSLNENDALPKAIRNYRKIEPSLKHETELRKNFNRYLTTPMVNLIDSLEQKSSKAFNDVLEKALHSHYEFYKEKREDYGRPGDSFGWVSLKLLSVCAHAYDKGIKIEVESDYLPYWMITGNFKDCKLTVS